MQSLNRDDVLRRYRRWRELRTEIQTAALKNMSHAAFLRGAKRIGLADGNTVIANSEAELSLAYDLALYSVGAGTTRAIDRCARTRPKNGDPDEALVLQALCAARFSVFRVIEKNEIVGVLLKDLLRGGEVWLLDEGLEQTLRHGEFLAARVAPVEGFVITCGVFVPFDRQAAGEMEAVLKIGNDQAISALLADDKRFPEHVYRIAVTRELMRRVAYQ